MARVLALVSDLMLASRVEAPLRAAGHEVTVRGGPSSVDAAAPPGFDAVVCDLDAVAPGDVVALGLPTLGFCSHLDTETRRAAIDAGIGSVVPRSRMSRELPELVERLLGDRGGGS